MINLKKKLNMDRYFEKYQKIEFIEDFLKDLKMTKSNKK